jgi:FAD/FMN-containing dehydrogenase
MLNTWVRNKEVALTNLATHEFLDGLVDPGRVRTIFPDPIIRGVVYKGVKIPESMRGTEPVTLVEVESAQEIAAILKKANDERMPIYVRQGTGFVALDIFRPEPPGAIALDLRRLNSIRPNLDGGYVEIGPAVTETTLNAVLEPDGFSFPEFIGPVTWGGLTSMNTSGRSVDSHTGKPGYYLMGLEVVLPTGEIVRTGTRSHRRPCGVDLTWLFTGFQALIGVITDIRLRLVPTPRNTRWGIAFMPSVEATGRTVGQVYRKGVPPPRFMELLDRQFLELGGLPGEIPGAMMLIGTDGWTSEEAEAKLDAILEVAREQGATRATPQTYEEFEAFVGFRESASGEGKESLLKKLDLFPLFGGTMDGPLDTMVACMEAAGRMMKEVADANPGVYGVRIGHIGAGTFHPVYYAPVAWDFERLQSLASEMRARMLELQLEFGCTTGEQGIFPQHYEWFHRYYGPEYVATVNRIKDALDPLHILNDARFKRPAFSSEQGL